MAPRRRKLKPLTAQELEDNGLLRELARRFRDPDNARALLISIGYPEEEIPSFSNANPNQVWRRAAEQIEFGIIPNGSDLRRLLAAAGERYPGCPLFTAWREEEPATDQSFGGISLAVTFRDGRIQEGDIDRVCNRARILADRLSLPGNVELGFASNGTVVLHLSETEADQAVPLIEQLSEQLGGRAEVGVASRGYRDYLFGRLYIEGPDERRFELTDVPASTPISQIVKATLNEYEDEAWPRDRKGQMRQATVDQVQDDGSSRRLDPHATLEESGIQEDDHLQVSPQSTAGALNPLLSQPALARVRSQVLDYARSHPGFEVKANGRFAPTEYLFAFQAAGWGPPPATGAPPDPVEQHEVFLILPQEFPMKAPQAFWQTPIFHPNIHPKNAAVCLGDLADQYKPALDFGRLCQMLVDIAGYRNYEVLEVYNDEARRWAISPEGQIAIEARGGRSVSRLWISQLQQEYGPSRPLRIRRLDR